MSRHLAIAVVVLVMGACGEPADEGASAPGARDSAEGAAPAAESRAARSLTCAAPFTPDATAATLAAAFGAENVIPETIDGPEGEKLNVTAIYPNDPARRIEVYFMDEEARTGLLSAVVKEDMSAWAGPGGVRIGDGIEKVEETNGGPFEIAGFDWDYGGYVADWKEGKLTAPASGCRTTMRFRRDPGNDDISIAGDSLFASDLPAIRAAKPVVVEFGISW